MSIDWRYAPAIAHCNICNASSRLFLAKSFEKTPSWIRGWKHGNLLDQFVHLLFFLLHLHFLLLKTAESICSKMVSKGLHRPLWDDRKSGLVSIDLVKFNSNHFKSALANTVFDNLCKTLSAHLSFPAQGCSGSPLLLPAKFALFAAASLLVEWALPLLLPSFWLERSAQVEPTSSAHQKKGHVPSEKNDFLTVLKQNQLVASWTPWVSNKFVSLFPHWFLHLIHRLNFQVLRLL